MTETDRSHSAKVYNKLPRPARKIVDKILTSHDFALGIKFILKSSNILKTTGWYESERKGAPVSADEEPIPWYTYSSLAFLGERLSDNLRVFEYGGGYSTIWYADRVDTVVAVEDSDTWVERLKTELPENADLYHRPSKDSYVHEIENHNEFDIIVIDGNSEFGRPECVTPAIKMLTSNGVIIWDDFGWYSFDDSSALRESGFKLLQFHGLKALGANESVTAIFYREENCLGI